MPHFPKAQMKKYKILQKHVRLTSECSKTHEMLPFLEGLQKY